MQRSESQLVVDRQFVSFIPQTPRFPFSALTLLVGRQEGHPACKTLDVGLLVVTI